jgi:hypothetical protein
MKDIKLIIGDTILKGDEKVVEFEKLNTSMLNSSNYDKELYIIISSKIKNYYLLYLILEKYNNDITILVDKKEYIELNNLKRFNIEIINNLNPETYRQLLHTLIYTKDFNEKVRLLDNFNIIYTSKILSLSYSNIKMLEELVNIEHYNKIVNKTNVNSLYALFPYEPLEIMPIFPKAKTLKKNNVKDKKETNNTSNIKNKLIVKQKTKKKSLFN